MDVPQATVRASGRTTVAPVTLTMCCATGTTEKSAQLRLAVPLLGPSPVRDVAIQMMFTMLAGAPTLPARPSFLSL